MTVCTSSKCGMLRQANSSNMEYCISVVLGAGLVLGVLVTTKRSHTNFLITDADIQLGRQSHHLQSSEQNHARCRGIRAAFDMFSWSWFRWPCVYNAGLAVVVTGAV